MNVIGIYLDDWKLKVGIRECLYKVMYFYCLWEVYALQR